MIDGRHSCFPYFAGDGHSATVRRVLASAQQLASTLQSAGSADGTAAGADPEDTEEDSDGGAGDAEAAARDSLSAEEHSAEDAAVLIALAFPDRVAQRRSRSNRCTQVTDRIRLHFAHELNMVAPSHFLA